MNFWSSSLINTFHQLGLNIFKKINKSPYLPLLQSGQSHVVDDVGKLVDQDVVGVVVGVKVSAHDVVEQHDGLAGQSSPANGVPLAAIKRAGAFAGSAANA
jgi:hypothetical protein